MKLTRASGTSYARRVMPHSTDSSSLLALAGEVQVPQPVVPFEGYFTPAQWNLWIGIEWTDVGPSRWAILLWIGYRCVVGIGSIAWPSVRWQVGLVVARCSSTVRRSTLHGHWMASHTTAIAYQSGRCKRPWPHIIADVHHGHARTLQRQRFGHISCS